MQIPPIVLNLLLCDSVHRDRDTGKFYLTGAFSRLNFAEFPGVLESCQVFLGLSEVNGSYDLRLRIVDVNDEEVPIHEIGGQLVGDNPLANFEFTLPLTMVRFLQAGEYRLQLLIDGEIIAERKISVRAKKTKGLTMNEKKYFSVSFPSIGYYYSTDPAFLKPPGKNFATTSNEPWDDIYHLLSPKPLRQPPPRPKPDEKPKDEPEKKLDTNPNEE